MITKERRLPANYLEKLIDVETNPKMFELLNEYAGLGTVELLKGFYYTKDYMRDLPKLTEEQEKNRGDIYNVILGVAILRLGESLADFHDYINTFKYTKEGAEITCKVDRGGRLREFIIECDINGVVTFIDETFRRVQTFSTWKEFIKEKDLSGNFEDLQDVLSSFYATWSYTIERLKPKAYVLALKGLTKVSFINYLKEEKCVNIDSFR